MRLACVEGRADRVPHVERAELMARELGDDARVFNHQNDAMVWLRHELR